MTFNFNINYGSAMNDYGIIGFSNLPTSLSIDTNNDFPSSNIYLYLYRKNISNANYIGKTVDMVVTGKKQTDTQTTQTSLSINGNNSALRINFTKTTNGIRIGSSSANDFKEIDSISINVYDVATPTTTESVTPTLNLTNAVLISDFRTKLRGSDSSGTSGFIFHYDGTLTADSCTYNGSNTKNKTAIVLITEYGIDEKYFAYNFSANEITGGINSIDIVVTATGTPQFNLADNLQNATINTNVFDKTGINNYVITPDSGCEFLQAPKITLLESGVSNDYVFTLSNNVYTLTIDGTQHQNATNGSINGVAVASQFSLTNSLQHATINTTIFDRTATNNYTITPDSGYMFLQAPKITLLENGVSNDYVFTLSNNVYVLTLDGTQHNTTSDGEISGTAIALQFNLTDSLQNATINTNVFDKTDINSYEITPDTGYEFLQPPKITLIENGVSVDYTFTLSNDIYVLTMDGTEHLTATGGEITGNATQEQDIAVIDFTLLEHITPTQDSATESILYQNALVKVKVDEGYVLDENILIANYPFIYDSINDVWYCNYQRFTPDLDRVYVTGKAIKASDIISNYGAIRAYKTTRTINQQLANKRFYNVNTNEYEDLGNYITSFVRYPFNVTTDGKSNVKYGWFDTQIQADLVEQQIYTLSLGKTLINGLYKNASDIENSDIDIILPYADIYKLDSRYINTEIEVIYKVDVLSNTAVIEIYSNDVLIDTVNTSIGYDIPYILKTDRITPNVNLQSNILKEKEPKVIVKQKAKVDYTYYDTLSRQTLTGLNGFVKCQNIVLAVSEQMTTKEQALLIDALTGGVIF